MAITKNKKRAAEESSVGTDSRMPKRGRLNLLESTATSSCPSSSKGRSSTNTTRTGVTLPTKLLEMPTGETIEVTETFPWYIKKDPTKHWQFSTFHLSYPRLRQPGHVTFTWAYEKLPYRGPPVFRATCWPNTPEDTIPKNLFVHPRRRSLAWSGPWAERKLAVERARYDRVKWFWLFNDGWAYLPGWDDKYRYAARRFQREMESPWVAAWLGELIGEEEVAKILAHMEVKKE